MRRAARVVFLLLVPQIAPLSVAFKIPTHMTLTAQALTDAAVLRAMSPYSFSFATMDEIKDGNACIDVGTSAFSTGDEMDKPCVPGTISVDQQLHVPEDHFDNEQIPKGSERLKFLKWSVVEYAKRGQFIEARKLLGMALHSVQDFYAHSNWVELGNTTIFAALDSPNGKIPLATTDLGTPNSTAFRLAGAKEEVCTARIELHDHDTAIGQRGETIKIPPYTVRVIEGGTLAPKAVTTKGFVLTSGYFFSDAVDPKIAKCQHGAILETIIPGINKDDTESPHGAVHFQEAQRLAGIHSTQFVLDIITQLKGNDVALAGLTGIEPKGCSCPQPVTEHIHGGGWIDVNATEMNDTGFTVKAGETIKIEAKRGGRIVWGRVGTFTGPELVAGPDGDPTASISNHLLWVPPPMRGFPIGMLYGVVVEGDPNVVNAPGTTVQSEPFPVGSGAFITMRLTGKLILSVNDGVLGNNRGCFQVKLSHVKP